MNTYILQTFYRPSSISETKEHSFIFTAEIDEAAIDYMYDEDQRKQFEHQFSVFQSLVRVENFHHVDKLGICVQSSLTTSLRTITVK